MSELSPECADIGQLLAAIDPLIYRRRLSLKGTTQFKTDEMV